jgi:predicted  nucleic acid-binding Zn-ribbon protein
VAQPSDLESRLTAVETRLEEVAADATAARHLAAARDRDIADLGVKVDANRTAINAREQTRARFDQLDHRFEQVDARLQSVEHNLTDTNSRVRSIEETQAEMRDLLVRALDQRT